jgi:hypothetical protein
MRWCETRPAFRDGCKNLHLTSLKTLAQYRTKDRLTCWNVRSPSTKKRGHAQRLECSDNESACFSAFTIFVWDWEPKFLFLVMHKITVLSDQDACSFENHKNQKRCYIPVSGRVLAADAPPIAVEPWYFLVSSLSRC